MRRLIEFIIAHSSIFVLIIYVSLSLRLLFCYNPYQKSVFFSSANLLAGSYYNLTSNLSGYIGLRDINTELQKQNSQLNMEVAYLNSELKRLRGDMSTDNYRVDSIISPLVFSVAQAISVTTANKFNYITLNKGKKDGVCDGMGVINRDGVVGIVCAVSDNFSVVIPLINPKLKLSCKVKGSEYFGSVAWDGNNPEYVNLEELPRHEKFSKGDTIVTSGYSSVFPDGMYVGTVADFAKQHNDNFYSLKVKLSIDYFRLGDVCIISNPAVTEQVKLKNEVARQ